ncbi:DNA-binding GntR family transcriptional regulator [Sphingomonas sp. UYAg733]
MAGLIVRTLSNQLVDLVRDRILSGEAAPDMPIRQDALASELGVSKIPLREALARLAEEGLIVSRANRGFFVTALTTEEAEEVYALRLKLEPQETARAAGQADDTERATACAALAALESSTSAHADDVGRLNRSFHLALIRPGRQRVTGNFLERLHVMADRYVRKHLEPTGRDRRANDEHQQIMSAWLARDTVAIEALIATHIGRTLDDLRLQLDAAE